MNLSRHWFVSLALLAGSSYASADGEIVDYSLRWSSAAPVSASESAADGSNLYRLSSLEQQIDVSDIDGEFQILLPQSGVNYSTHLKLAIDAQQQAAADKQSRGDVSLVSSLYQVGYGEQLSSWYGGVNLSVEQFNGDYQREEGDLWSVGLYAGSRFALTGLDADAPLWLLSLQGEYDEAYFDDNQSSTYAARGNWFLTPGVHWVADGFSLTAAVQVPLDSRRDNTDLDAPDYRLRADFERRF